MNETLIECRLIHLIRCLFNASDESGEHWSVWRFGFFFVVSALFLILSTLVAIQFSMYSLSFDHLSIGMNRMWNLLLNFHFTYLKNALLKWHLEHFLRSPVKEATASTDFDGGCCTHQHQSSIDSSYWNSKEEIDFNIYFWNGFLPHQIQSSSFFISVEWWSNDSRTIRVFIFCFSRFVLYGNRTAIKCTHQSMFDHKICINFCCCLLVCFRPSILYIDRNNFSLTFRWGKVVKTEFKYFSQFYSIFFRSFVLLLFRDS